MRSPRWEIATALVPTTVDETIEVLLKARGIKSIKAKKEFLSPRKPANITALEIGIKEKDLKKAIARIKKAIKDDEQIVVYGDYDADGICGTAIMWEALHKLGARATPYIPDRFNDGYGLNPTSVAKLKEKFPDLTLIITVDNGIVAFDGVEAANKLNIDVIITDHHTTKEKLPKAHAIIHTLSTSGSGVAWFFTKELMPTSNGLELAAIGTIADQLVLTGVNRSIVKYGLEELNKTSRVGLKKLLAVSGLLEKKLGTYEVNFAIAPRINATGRISQGIEALRLLCTTSPGRAEKLAILLNDLNLERQQIVAKALEQVDSLPESTELIVTLASAEYHEGVIGLIAGKITERYWRPAIVYSLREGYAKASARSIEGFSIIEAIRSAEELIIEGGGHHMAAGFSIKLENIEVFNNKIQELSKPLLTEDTTQRTVKIDCRVNFNLLNRDLYSRLVEFEPFGSGNPAPTFLLEGATLESQKLVGSDKKHLKITVQEAGQKMEGIMFGQSEEIKAKKVDLVFRLTENNWNNRSTIELTIRDIKKHGRK